MNNYKVTIEGGKLTSLIQDTDDTWPSEITTGIRVIQTSENSCNKGVYNLRGQYLGTDMKALPKGIYVVDGKKVVK